MEILLTGATGQLGSDLKPLLIKEGCGVQAFSSSSLDITDREKVFNAIADNKPEVIINCAAYTKVDLAEKERERAFAVNRDGAKNLAEAAQKTGSALIHISTDFVFDGKKSTPYMETDKTNPLSVYGESKLEGENEIVKILKRRIIIRASWLYGVEGNNFVKTILKLAGERESLKIVFDQAGTPTWTYDLAGAVVKIVNDLKAGKKEYGIYNYSNEGVASWYDFAEAIVDEAKGAGIKLNCGSIEPILTSEYPTPAKRPAYSVLDKRKIKAAFDIAIPHWRRSLKEMIKELCRKNGGRGA
ncbi:MAG: dTDP-4-dehydrorhamnose reductase [Deltaproteobacteria bacterium]|nr:dTDP-4-dehydrorhamnose reductase [Deltaproteobacteria bacterium]